MILCPTCRGALSPGQQHCGICGTDVRAQTGADPTTVAAPPGYGPIPPPLPPPPPQQASHPPAYPVQPYPQQPYVPVYPAQHYAQPVSVVPVVPVYPVVGAVGPPKSKAVAALLCFFLGGLGIHRFYSGQTGLGLALLLTTLILTPLTFGLWFFVTLVWVLVDFILIVSGSVLDEWGRPLI